MLRTRLVGEVDDAFADRLQPGDRFLLDGRCLEFRRREDQALLVHEVVGRPVVPRWAGQKSACPPLACSGQKSAWRTASNLKVLICPRGIRSKDAHAASKGAQVFFVFPRARARGRRDSHLDAGAGGAVDVDFSRRREKLSWSHHDVAVSA